MERPYFRKYGKEAGSASGKSVRILLKAYGYSSYDLMYEHVLMALA